MILNLHTKILVKKAHLQFTKQVFVAYIPLLLTHSIVMVMFPRKKKYLDVLPRKPTEISASIDLDLREF